MSSSELALESAEALAIVAPESPQPLPLTANSSRCTSPLSPPSDLNASASSVDEESATTLNLSLPSKQQQLQNNNGSAKSSTSSSSIGSSSKQSPSPSVSNNHAISFREHQDPSGGAASSSPSSRPSHKLKSDSSIVPSRGKSKHTSQLSYAADYAAIPNPQSPDFVNLLLEYRQVLLDVLAKSITLNDTESSEPKSVTLPLKCQCGFTSKLSNQITRSSTYVHQLELRFRSLMEVSRANESKYTPRRPWFINSAPTATASAPLPGAPMYPMPSSGGGGKSSLLDKKALLSRQPVAGGGGGKSVSLFRSGASSINSSINGDDEDVDSDEDDVNDDNLPGNLSLNISAFNNGSIEEMNGGGKTILEGYLESMKNNLPSEDGSDEDDDKDQDGDDDDLDGTTTCETDDPHRGPGKRIDLKTKKLVVQMQNSGFSFTNISRQIGISRKSVRRIVSNYRAYGMLEKKRESRIQKGQNGLVVQNGANMISLQDMYGDGMDDDGDLDDEEKEMVVDEDAGDDDDQDLEDEEDNAHDEMSLKHEMDASAIVPSPFPLALTKPHIKQRKAMSLIHSSFNGNGGGGYPHHAQHSPQQAHMNSNGNLMNSHLSLIHQSDRFKPYDMKMSSRANAPSELLNAPHHRISKSSQIVPQPNPSKLYAMQRQQQHHHQQQQQQQQQHSAIRLSNSNTPRGDSHHRMKSSSKMNRHSSEMSLKESIMVPEADKNNNTTLANCNLTISTAPNHMNGGGGGHANNSNGGQHSPVESSSLLPPIPASLADSNSDSEANLVPRPFVDGFPAGIMNSLNPNRATKLTLEDFNVVWQLRSQHWTHNQIRKYFEQRGKSISKSSISRIMNGKQRNFQQFFNVIPSSL